MMENKEKKIIGMTIAAAGAAGALAGAIRFFRGSVPEEVRAFDYADGGLYDEAAGIPENSVGAYEAAIAQKTGILADVRLSHDGVPVLIRDEALMELCGMDGVVEGTPWELLKTYRLRNTEYRIQGLMTLFNQVDDQVPVILNLHVGNDNLEELCDETLQRLDAYDGLAIITSEDRKVLRWFKQNAPEYIRVSFGRI